MACTEESKELSICHINARSILAYNAESGSNQFKMDEIRHILSDQLKYNLITVSETWLSANISTEEDDLKIDNYTLHRKDRQNGNRGGGVCIFISNDLFCIERPDLSPIAIEILWLEIHVNHKKILVGVCYRPPGQNRDEQNTFFSNLEMSFEMAKQSDFDVIVLLGDFNDKCTDWNLPHVSSEVGNKLADMLIQNNLYQIITEPTHYSENSASLLDLIITDSPHMFLTSGVSPPLANLDHCTIYGTLDIKLHRSKAFKRTVWDFKSADKEKLNEAMENAPWNLSYILYEDLNEIVELSSSIITSVCAENIRNKSVTIRTKDKPWMCNEVRYILRKRDRCFRKYKRTLSEQDRFYFYLARREVNRAKRNAKKRFEQKMVTSFSKPNLSTREFWKLSKRILGEKSDRNIPPLMHNNILVSEDETKANLFNDYFASISSLDTDGALPQLPGFTFETDSRIELVQTTDIEVEKLLSLLNPNKSTGPDGIGNWVLKNCSHTLANPLTKLFNNLLEKGSFPDVWKTANVCPVQKKGNKSEISNYRPISLLSNMSKVLEKVVYKRLYDYLMENNLLIEQNSGFKQNDSTINQLLKIVHQIYVNINEGKDTCLVFLDVSKAFDKVWIDGLLFKIQQLGIVGKLFD